MDVHFELSASTLPTQIFNLHDEFLHTTSKTENSNFLKGAKWSSDGISFLTVADDATLRVYDLPPEHCNDIIIDIDNTAVHNDTDQSTKQTTPNQTSSTDPFWPALRIPAGELVYDYCWYSHAKAADLSTFCFATTSRSHPIHLYDAYTGELRCSYCPYNSMDELSPAYSIAFNKDGTQLYAGCIAAIHIFDVNRPGKHDTPIHTFRKKEEGQPGIISCIAYAPDASGLMAAGAFSGITALYDVRTAEQLYLLQGHTGGVTHIEFSADGNYVYTGARQDDNIYCWDARYGSGAVYTIVRKTPKTNQRMYFDIESCGRHMVSGGEDGIVRMYDLRDGSEIGVFRGADDTVNGCEFHPALPLVLTASGQRRFYFDTSDSESEKENEEGVDADGKNGIAMSCGTKDGMLSRNENCLNCWRFQTSSSASQNE